MSRRLLLIALGACALGACGSTKPEPGPGTTGPGTTGPGTTATDGPDTSCSTGDDCALVPACCGCDAGGRQIAIRADAVAAFEAARPARCADQMCAQVISTDPSCDAEAICGSTGRCEVAPHLQAQ